MSFPDFFFERLTSEIHQQMEGVLALTERLARQPLGADALASVAGVAEAAASVRQILESCADLKGAAATGIDFQPIPYRLRDLADQIEVRWGQKAAKSGVTLLVSYDGAPETMALIDPARVMQVFDGFIGQALGGVRHGAVEATLRAHAVGDMLRLEGRVRGAGTRSAGDKTLDIKEVEALFGLETALSVELGRQIIRSFGGEVGMEANAGAGETLVFEFSAQHASEAAEPGDSALTDHAPQRAAHILVVDDNATNRMVAETLCEMFDCTSEPAVDGVEALEAARTGRFDLILMDIKMPRMDGVSATHAIRALPGRAGSVPIIALTANADPEDAAGYLAAGMNGVVEKPMKPETLLRALQDNLGGEQEAVAA